jgi:hypothetical protein
MAPCRYRLYCWRFGHSYYLARKLKAVTISETSTVQPTSTWYHHGEARVISHRDVISYTRVFNWAQRHEGVLREWRYSATHSLTSALDGPARFTPRERAPGTHWIGGWVGPRAVLDVMVKRKIPSPRRESNPRTPICIAQLSAIPTELSRHT